MVGKERATQALEKSLEGRDRARLLAFLAEMPPEDLCALSSESSDEDIILFVRDCAARAHGDTIISRFERLAGSKLTSRERAELLLKEGMVYALDRGIMDHDTARVVLRRLRNELHTSTKKVILEQTGYLIDDRIGRGQTELYAAFKEASVVCAKVFTGPGAAEAMAHEKAVSDDVHGTVCCPTLIKVLDAFAVEPDRDKRPEAHPRFVVILPLLAISVHDLLMCPGAKDHEAAYIAACALAALAGLAMVGRAHNDVKPANLMFTSNEKRIVLVDLRSSTEVGRRPTEGTDAYSLGIRDYAGLRRDLVCLASTLAALGGSFIPWEPLMRCSSEWELLDNLRCVREERAAASGDGHDLQHPLASDLALEVLEHAQSPDAASVDALRSLFDRVVAHVARLEDAAAAERVSSWWPTKCGT